MLAFTSGRRSLCVNNRSVRQASIGRRRSQALAGLPLPLLLTLLLSLLLSLLVLFVRRLRI